MPVVGPPLPRAPVQSGSTPRYPVDLTLPRPEKAPLPGPQITQPVGRYKTGLIESELEKLLRPGRARDVRAIAPREAGPIPKSASEYSKTPFESYPADWADHFTSEEIQAALMESKARRSATAPTSDPFRDPTAKLTTEELSALLSELAHRNAPNEFRTKLGILEESQQRGARRLGTLSLPDEIDPMVSVIVRRAVASGNQDVLDAIKDAAQSPNEQNIAGLAVLLLEFTPATWQADILMISKRIANSAAAARLASNPSRGPIEMHEASMSASVDDLQRMLLKENIPAKNRAYAEAAGLFIGSEDKPSGISVKAKPKWISVPDAAQPAHRRVFDITSQIIKRGNKMRPDTANAPWLTGVLEKARTAQGGVRGIADELARMYDEATGSAPVSPMIHPQPQEQYGYPGKIVLNEPESVFTHGEAGGTGSRMTTTGRDLWEPLGRESEVFPQSDTVSLRRLFMRAAARELNAGNYDEFQRVWDDFDSAKKWGAPPTIDPVALNAPGQNHRAMQLLRSVMADPDLYEPLGPTGLENLAKAAGYRPDIGQAESMIGIIKAKGPTGRPLYDTEHVIWSLSRQNESKLLSLAFGTMSGRISKPATWAFQSVDSVASAAASEIAKAGPGEQAKAYMAIASAYPDQWSRIGETHVGDFGEWRPGLNKGAAEVSDKIATIAKRASPNRSGDGFNVDQIADSKLLKVLGEATQSYSIEPNQARRPPLNLDAEMPYESKEYKRAIERAVAKPYQAWIGWRTDPVTEKVIAGVMAANPGMSEAGAIQLGIFEGKIAKPVQQSQREQFEVRKAILKNLWEQIGEDPHGFTLHSVAFLEKNGIHVPQSVKDLASDPSLAYKPSNTVSSQIAASEPEGGFATSADDLLKSIATESEAPPMATDAENLKAIEERRARMKASK